MENNEYDDLVQESNDSDVSNLQQAQFVNQDIEPDRKAEAIKLADRYKVPVDFAERNFDEFKKKQAIANADEYEDLVKNYQGTSSFLKNIDNYGVTKDDIPALKNVEDTVKEKTFLGDMGKSLQYGLSQFNVSIGQVPALIYDVAAYPQNKIAQLMGSNYRVKSSDIPALKSGFGMVDYYKRGQDTVRNELPELGDNIIEEVTKGNYSKAGKALAVQLGANAPQQLAMLAAAYFSGGSSTVALAGAGVTTAATANAEAQDKGLDVANTLPGSVAKGVIESATEKLGTFSFVEKWGASLAKVAGKEGYKEVMKAFAKTVAASAITEGTEEAVTSAAQDFVDYATGENPQAFDGMLNRAINAGLIGAASGASMTSVTAQAVGFKKALEVKQAESEKKFYLDLERGVINTKTLKRLPEKIQEHITESVKDGPVENIYISAEAFKQFFQKKDMSPVEQAEAMGFGDEYKRAVETGSDIVLPTGQWARQAGTEHYAAMQDDVKFSSDGQTVKEAKAEEQAIKDELKTQLEAAKKAESEGKEIVDDVYNQLVAAGVPKSEAKNSAVIYRALGVLAQREGISPASLYQKYGLKIIGEQSYNGEGAIALPSDLKEMPLRKDENGEWVYRPEVISQMKESADSVLFNIIQDQQDGKILTDEQTEILNQAYSRKVYFQKNKTNLDRAKEMGFDTSKVYYHGTNQKFDEFNVDKSNKSYWGKGIYLTQDKGEAGTYGKNILETFVKKGKVFDILTDVPPKTFTDWMKKNKPQEHKDLVKALGGVDAYNYIDAAKNAMSPEQFTKLFQDAGYSAVSMGDIINVFDPKNIRSTDAAFENLDSAKLYAQQGDSSVQGLYNPDQNVIKLFASRDQSTFLHESGHFFLKVVSDLAVQENASESLKKDFATIKEWLGSEDVNSIDAQEKWARGFEAYLLKGEAPTTALRKAFNTFKTWLLRVYKNIEGLSRQAGMKVEVSPEITGVMDRLLATEEEINAAQASIGLNALLKDPIASGMNEKDAAKYKEVLKESRLYAEAKLNERLLSDLNKKQSQEYKAKFDEYYNQNLKTLFNRPIFQALAVLKTGKTYLGQEVAEKIKIDKQSVIDRMGKQVADLMPKNVFNSEIGQDYGVVASIFGFESGEAFVQEMVATPKIEDVARHQANEQIKNDFPDLYKDPEISDAAKMALHNEKRSEALKYELDFLQNKYNSIYKDAIRRVVKRSPIDQQVREEARKIVGDLKTKDLKPHLFLSAEVKASKEAGIKLAKGDIKGALEAKRVEYLNHEIYRAVTDAKEDVKKSVKDFRKLFEKTEDIAKKRDADLINTAKAILDRFGITKGGVVNPFDYLNKVEQYDPEQFGSLKPIIESAIEGSADYNAVSYDKFVEMRDTVQALWDLAKNVREMEIDGRAVQLEQAAQDVNLQIDKHKSGEAPPAIKQDLSNIEKFKIKLLGAKAALTRVEAWSDLMDLGQAGPFKKYIWNPVSEAVTQYRLNKSKVISEYKSILEEYKDIFKGGAIIASELDGFVFKDKSHLLMALLHTGNESNKSKLLRGRNWGTVNEDATLDSSKFDSMISRMQQDGTLTKRDYEFAQKIWDLMDTMKPAAQKAHKKMYGYYFNEITANEIKTPFGDFRGGYVPAKVDVYTNEDAAIREERNDLEKNNNSFQFPTTGRGFTKGRVDAYAAPLSLEMNLLGSHIDGVSRFSYIEPTVKQVSRLLMNKDLRANLAEVDPTIAREMLVPWLQRTAQQKVVLPSTSGVGKLTDMFASYLRTSVAMQFMVGNVTNALQQVTGISVAASKVAPKYLSLSMFNYLTDRKAMTESIYEKSDFMKATQGDNIHEAQEAIQQIITNPSTFEKIQSFAKAHTYFLQSATQNMVNTIVWSGAYNEAVTKGLSELEAVRSADSAVRTTQGTNNPEDISRYETGTATARLFTQFAGYFNMLANLNNAEVQKIAKTVGLRKGAGKLFYLYVTAMMLPAVLSDLIVRSFRGKGLDEEDDGPVDDLLAIFFGSQFKTATAMVPYVGPMINAGVNNFNKVAYDDRLSFSPVLSVLESAAGVPKKVHDMASKEEIKKQGVKDILQLIGIAAQVPTGPIGKPVGYLMDVNTGKANPKNPVDFTRGLISGQPGK